MVKKHLSLWQITDLTATVKKVELGGFGSATPMYNGEPWYPESITVDGTVFQHSSGEDYTTDGTANYVFTFSNNVDAGTATRILQLRSTRSLHGMRTSK